MTASLASLIFNPIFFRFLTTVLDSLFRTYTANASHSREHRAPLPTASTTTSSGNTYGLFTLNNSSNATAVPEQRRNRENDQEQRRNDVTFINVLIGMALPALSYFAAGVAFMGGILFFLWVLSFCSGQQATQSQTAQHALASTSAAAAPSNQNGTHSNDTFSHSANAQPPDLDQKIALLAARFPNVDCQDLSDVLLANGYCIELAEDFLSEAAAS